jgi:hypothetical protein
LLLAGIPGCLSAISGVRKYPSSQLWTSTLLFVIGEIKPKSETKK